MSHKSRFLLLALCVALLVASPAQAYRTVYIGNFLENSVGPAGNATDRQLLYNAVKWASNKPVGPYTVTVLRGFGATNTFYWTDFDAAYPDVTVNFIPGTVTAAAIATAAPDVMVISNNWHGDPNDPAIPPANPGGADWVFTPAEQLAIRGAVYGGLGLIGTAGSFGQFTYSPWPWNPATSYRNFQLADLFGLASTGGGVPACANTLVWSRGGTIGGCTYPGTRPLTNIVNDSPGHPIMAGLPATWATSFTTAAAQWMAIAPSPAPLAVQLGRYASGATTFGDSLIVARDVPPTCPPPSVASFSPTSGTANPTDCCRTETFSVGLGGQLPIDYSVTILPPAGGSATAVPSGTTTTGAISFTSTLCAGVDVPAAGKAFSIVLTLSNCAGSNTRVIPVNYTLFDVTPPLFASGGTDLFCAWPPNHNWVPTTFGQGAGQVDPTGRAVDNCTSPASLNMSFNGLVSNEPDNGTGDGNTEVDVDLSPDGKTAFFRAERSGGGDGRRYDVQIRATDLAGNFAAGSVGTIYIPHDQSDVDYECVNSARVGDK